jgi:hypothetical protein
VLESAPPSQAQALTFTGKGVVALESIDPPVGAPRDGTKSDGGSTGVLYFVRWSARIKVVVVPSRDGTRIKGWEYREFIFLGTTIERGRLRKGLLPQFFC